MPEAIHPPTSIECHYSDPAERARIIIYRALQNRWYRLVDVLIREDATTDELLFCLKELESACHFTTLGIAPVEVEASDDNHS